MRLLRSLSILVLAATAACSGGSSSTTGDAPDAGPSRMTLEVILLDDQADPFATLPPPLPKGLAPFQEAVVLGPEHVELRTFVRLVVQPGETLPQALTRARPWLDARPLPPGDRLVFSEIREENEATKVREAVGVRTYVATSKVILGQADVADASLGAMPDAQQKPQPVAMIELTPAAGERFRVFTKENALRRIAVLVGGIVVMSARIEDEITGGKISISMDSELPYETKRAELERMVSGIKPKTATPTPPE
jgi:hypothetical protein